MSASKLRLPTYSSLLQPNDSEDVNSPMSPTNQQLGDETNQRCDDYRCQCMEHLHTWHQGHGPLLDDLASLIASSRDRVFCHARISILQVEPKTGMFQVRMVCQWAFRTFSPKNDTEISYRGVPGIRVPGIEVDVLESRVWKDLESMKNNESCAQCGSPNSTRNSIFWRGTSIFVLRGYKRYWVRDFPFDRHVISLHQMDFVWRPSKDEATFYDTMKVVLLKVETTSVLSDWTPNTAVVSVDDGEVKTHDRSMPLAPDGSDHLNHTYASKFKIRLRIERVHGFFVRQIFVISTLIFLSSCSPLALPPKQDTMDTRLSVYSAGLLTLVAFKYGIMDHLPSVPYSTFTDDFLMWQICVIVVLIVECLVSFRCEVALMHIIDELENGLLLFLGVVWITWLLYISRWKPVMREPWCRIPLGDTDALDAAGQDLFRSYTSKNILTHSTGLDRNLERKVNSVAAFKAMNAQ